MDGVTSYSLFSLLGDYEIGEDGQGDGESEQTLWTKSPKFDTLPGDSFIWANSSTNVTKELELPIDMQFNAGHLMSIIVYSVLFVLSATGKHLLTYIYVKIMRI